MTTLLTLFDAAGAWASLNPQQQAEIGVAAIIQGLGLQGSQSGEVRPQAYEAAATEGLIALENAVSLALPEAVMTGALPDLSAIGVEACRHCGCTDRCGCPEGCGWVEPRLCSACAEDRA